LRRRIADRRAGAPRRERGGGPGAVRADPRRVHPHRAGAGRAARRRAACRDVGARGPARVHSLGRRLRRVRAPAFRGRGRVLRLRRRRRRLPPLHAARTRPWLRSHHPSGGAAGAPQSHARQGRLRRAARRALGAAATVRRAPPRRGRDAPLVPLPGQRAGATLMPHLVLGTAGHIDHGKTALVRALTGVDTDRLAEEKRRGITIDLGFANLRLPDGQELAVVDVPGHEAFIRNMLAGATGIDIVLLVIAADEGVMPQTREHLAIVDLLGVRCGVVAITKVDLVEREWLDLVMEDVRAALADTPFADAPLVPVSARTGEGLDALVAAIADAARATAERDHDDLFRLPIDRVFTIRGTGTVVTGTVWSGRLRVGAAVRVLPQDLHARVRGAQVHGRDAPCVSAGQRAALALAGVERDQLGRGDVIVADEAWAATTRLTALVRVLPASPWPLRTRQRVRFHLGTAEIMGRVRPLDAPEIPPGQTG